MRPGSDDAPEPAVDVELDGRLADAHAAVLAREAERRRALEELAPPRPRAHSGWVAAASAAWLLVALAIISPPAMLRGATDHPFVPASGQAQHSMRYGIWLAHQRVSAFTHREGRLPSFLREAGVTDPSIVLEVTGEQRYSLVGEAEGETLRFDSEMSVDSFLGESLVQLRASLPD